MPFFEHNGIKIHYVDVDNRDDKNTGVPLVLVHGAGSSHLAWALQLRNLSSDYRLVAIDLSGHGKSDDFMGDISIQRHFAGDVAALVRHLDLHDFICVGHSMGGGVVMSYALKDTSMKPRALVLVDTSSNLDLTKLGVGLAKDTIEDRARLFKNEFFHNITDTVQVKRAEARLLAANPTVMIRDLEACNKFNITNHLGEIDIPTFVIVGENDDVTTPRMAKRLVTALPRAGIAVVKGAYHVPMQEQPAEFNRLLRKFVDWAMKNA